MKKLEKILFNDELRLLLERVESRNHFSGVLWSLELFLNNTSMFSQLELYQKMEKLYNNHLNDAKQGNCNLESAKKDTSNLALFYFFKTLNIPSLGTGKSEPDKEDILILSELLSKIYSDLRNMPDFCNVAQITVRLIGALNPYFSIGVISDFIAEIEMIFDDILEETFDVFEFHYNLRLSLFELRNRISKMKVVNIYLLGEDKYGLLESQRKNAKNSIYIYTESVELNTNQMNILWITNEIFEVPNSIATAFDYIITLEDILEMMETSVNNLKKLPINMRSYYQFQRELLLYSNKQIETIVLGSSYGLWGLSRQFSDFDFVKLTNLGQDPFMTYSFLNFFLEQTTYTEKLKRCIIPIGHWFFFRDNSLSVNPFEIERMTTFFREIVGSTHNYNKNFVPDFYDSMSRESKYNVYLKQYLDVVQLNNQIFSTVLNSDDAFISPLQGDFSDLAKFESIVETKVIVDKFSSFLKYPHTFSENVRIFLDMLDLLNKYDIDLILILTPLSKRYFEILDSNLKIAFENIINETSSRYCYIDMNQIDEIEFVESDFADCHHLNYRGTEKFTRYINKIIQDDTSS